jgi:hypothetical protein
MGRKAQVESADRSFGKSQRALVGDSENDLNLKG